MSSVNEKTRIAKALVTLTDETSVKISTNLEKKDLSFSELKNIINVDKNTLYYNIKKLIKSGIIVNYYLKKEGSSEYSFYKLTPFGHCT